MNDETIHVVIPAVGEYRKWAEITGRSAKKGSSLPLEIHYLDWSNVDKKRMESLGDWHGSAITWSRLFLPEILPNEVDWVISCDADILFRGDIAELWSLRDERYLIMASRDSQPPWRRLHPDVEDWLHKHPEVKADEILCCGLALINLKRWRDEGWQKKVDEFLSRCAPLPFADQLPLNIVFNSYKACLPRAWGCFSGDRNRDVDYNGNCAIHYVGDTPWRRNGLTRLMSDAVVLWRKEAGMSCGGWRRWLWLALRMTSSLWCWNKKMAWHFRTAVR